MKKGITARAHTNIALVKYWGKKNDKLNIPENSSLSLTLNDFYTETTVEFDSKLKSDQITFDGKKLKADEKTRIVNFLNLIRKIAFKNEYARVITNNHVPTSAGLASSASGFAALAAAATRAIGLDLSDKELSEVARQGSGSATRSIFGGFVEWKKGYGDRTSFAVPIPGSDDWDLNVIAVLTDKTQKKISSTEGMKLSKETSPYYSAWKKVSSKDLKTMKNAISNKDFSLLGKTAEENAMRMHALTFSSSPSFTYLNGHTLKVINKVKELRNKGIECYFTIDAGPNVKILVEKDNATKVTAALKQSFGKDNVIKTTAGPGIEYLN